MEKQEKTEITIRVFTFLMQKMIFPYFRFSKGIIARENVENCIDNLEKIYGEISRDRLIDYCICQVYAISQFDEEYIKRWNVTHSFGKKALERFMNQSTEFRKYYEDKLLKKHEVSREGLYKSFRDKKEHPLQKFLNPTYEENTKKRALNKEAGFVLCEVLTLLWNPFSVSCQCCTFSRECADRLSLKIPELYRLRKEAIQKDGNEGE